MTIHDLFSFFDWVATSELWALGRGKNGGRLVDVFYCIMSARFEHRCEQ
jgi:hypothetical protein